MRQNRTLVDKSCSVHPKIIRHLNLLEILREREGLTRMPCQWTVAAWIGISFLTLTMTAAPFLTRMTGPGKWLLMVIIRRSSRPSSIWIFRSSSSGLFNSPSAPFGALLFSRFRKFAKLFKFNWFFISETPFKQLKFTKNDAWIYIFFVVLRNDSCKIGLFWHWPWPVFRQYRRHIL